MRHLAGSGTYLYGVAPELCLRSVGSVVECRSRPMPILRILHLSDLRNCGSAVPSAAVRGVAWVELLDEVAEVGLVDLIALTGDLASTGRGEEFSALTPFLERTCARLGVSPDRLFVVPGDRDVGPALTSSQESRLIALASRDPGGVSAWIAGCGPPPAGADPGWSAAIFARQRSFWTWLTDELQQPERRVVDALGYHANIPIAGSHAQVQVYGLNSAWLSSQNLPGGAALLGRDQVSAIVRDASGATRPGFRLALVHHPPSAIADGEECSRILAGAVDLVLCGDGPHRRFAELTKGVRVLATGPLGDESAGASSCQLIQIETDSAGRPIGFAARIWTWSAAQACWLSDAPGVSAARRGRIYWSGTAQAVPRHPLRFGRAPTLEGVLAQLFASTDELRKWLYMRVPEIYADLPGGTASLAEISFAARELLERRGLFDDELLDALADFSPAHAPAVVELRDRTAAPAPMQAAMVATSRPASIPTQADSVVQHSLSSAQQRRANLRDAGPDAAAVESEILALSGLLRQGPGAKPGEALANGRYVLQDVLGRGGFATVWRARDRVEKRDVALKLLYSQDAQDPARSDRFFRGARAMQQLKHPAVVRVLSAGGREQPQPFFVMELIDGPNLHDSVIRGPRLRLADIVAIACTIGEALVEAHARGMVHRDVKPANILLDRAGSAFLTDFDLVRGRDTTGGTRTGGMGTLLYAAPELVQNADDADARADIYGLGMTVLFMLFGKDLPYKDIVRNPEAILARVDCPAAMKRTVLNAIAWDREQRFSDMASFCAALSETDGSQLAAASRAVMPVSVKRRAFVEVWVFAAVALALVSTVIALASWTGSPTSRADETPAAPGPKVERPVLVPVQKKLPLPPHVEPDSSQRDMPGPATPASPPVESPPMESLPAESPAPTAGPKTKSAGSRGEVSRSITKVAPKDADPVLKVEPLPPKDVPEPAPMRTAAQARPLIERELRVFGDRNRVACRKKTNDTDPSEPLKLDEVVDIKVVVNSDGGVASAVSTGTGEGTPLADCMAGKLRGARVSPFVGGAEEFTLNFSI